MFVIHETHSFGVNINIDDKYVASRRHDCWVQLHLKIC